MLNVEKIKDELNILNGLIGKKDIEEDEQLLLDLYQNFADAKNIIKFICVFVDVFV